MILFHAGFGGGFVGVDFYDRRARRILPALFVVLLASLPLGWMSWRYVERLFRN